VSEPLSKAEISLLRKAFRMPSVQTMTSRKTSITNAFVCAIIPVVRPTPEEIKEVLEIFEMTPQDVRCNYCGDKSSEWDHLRPLVIARRPTGHISEIANLVPSCGKCNQSKGNSAWRTWMLGGAPQCPTVRGIPDAPQRIARLEAFERWRQPTLVDFERILGSSAFSKYWNELDAVVDLMEDSQKLANELRAKIANARVDWEIRPLTDSKDNGNN
jgi:hypothetical protein